MVIKPEEAKKKAEESEKAQIKHRARHLEDEIEKSLREMVAARAQRSYRYCSWSCGSNDEKILQAVAEDYRNAGWEMEYEQITGGIGTRTYITLKLGADTSGKGKNPLLLASIVEMEVKKREEEQANKYEEKIDSELIRDCEKKIVWYQIPITMENTVKDMLMEKYSAAGWKVDMRQRRDRDRNWHEVTNDYLVFERGD